MSRNEIVKRIILSLTIGILLAAITTEVAYQVLKRENRAPEQIRLIIPAGTAERVAAGQAPPSIPSNMNFVIGDTLVVVNQDSVDHHLGTLWIPAGTTASMRLETEQNYAMECSFQPTKYQGIEVYPPVTLGTRIEGILFAGLPLGMLLAVYSVLLTPKKKATPT